jgi:hypothetical protein
MRAAIATLSERATGSISRCMYLRPSATYTGGPHGTNLRGGRASLLPSPPPATHACHEGNRRAERGASTPQLLPDNVMWQGTILCEYVQSTSTTGAVLYFGKSCRSVAASIALGCTRQKLLGTAASVLLLSSSSSSSNSSCSSLRRLAWHMAHSRVGLDHGRRCHWGGCAEACR